MGYLVPVEKGLSDKQKRGVVAGLSAVGAAAGTAGLLYGARDVRAMRLAGKKVPLRTKAFMGLETAGLGGEFGATHFLHQDATAPDQQQPQTQQPQQKKPRLPGLIKLRPAPIAKSSRERGLAELAKAEQHLEGVAKYVRRSVPNPTDELDLVAAAMLLLKAEHGESKLPWKRRRQIADQLEAAIARGYLNAPYTAGRR